MKKKLIILAIAIGLATTPVTTLAAYPPTDLLCPGCTSGADCSSFNDFTVSAATNTSTNIHWNCTPVMPYPGPYNCNSVLFSLFDSATNINQAGGFLGGPCSGIGWIEQSCDFSITFSTLLAGSYYVEGTSYPFGGQFYHFYSQEFVLGAPLVLLRLPARQ